MIDMNLQGKRAIICGASQGIGASSAKALASLGCQCILIARNLEKLELVKSELDGTGHECHSLDLSNLKELDSALPGILSESGAQILVHNLGGPKGGPLREASEHELESAFQAHIGSAQVLSRHLIPHMKKANYGRLIHVISTSVKAPIVNLGVSNTIRGAMANWSKTMAMELGPFGITVNNILPGFTQTPRLDSILKARSEREGIPEEKVRENFIQSVPLRRIGKPSETASAIGFLASPAASYINGINLPVDGGRTPSL